MGVDALAAGVDADAGGVEIDEVPSPAETTATFFLTDEGLMRAACAEDTRGLDCEG